MATTVTKQIVRGERIGEVTFCEQRTKKYYDDNNKLYEIWGNKKGDWFFAEEVREVLDKIKPSDGYYLLKIMSHLNDFNEICSYNSHRQRLEPIHSQADFADFLGLSKPSMSAFLKRMRQLQIILPALHVVADSKKLAKKFYFTPVMLLRKKKIKLDFYATFKDVINPRLTNAARYDLEGLIKSDAPRSKCQEDKKEEIAAVKDIVDDNISDAEISAAVDNLLNKMKEKKEPQPMDLFNVFGEEENARQKARTAKFNPFLAAAIVDEYLYRGQQPQLYAMADGGMVKTDYSDSKDIYFLPNTPAEYHDKKPKNSDIVNFNSWYIDIDAGKDENGHYFTVTKVEKRKELMKAVINQLPLPTYVNVTRNGYHIYFATDGVKNEEEWREVENKLIETIEIADKAVKDPARLMRMPASWWHKGDKSAAAGCESYRCHPLVANRVKYSAAELLTELDRVAVNVKKACDSYQQAFGNINEGNGKVAAKVNVTADNNARIADIRSLTTTTFDIPTATTTVDNAKDWLRQQSLAEFLQIANPNSFNCIFHDDNNPSATIYSNVTGDRYVCAAASCSVSAHGWDIIDCVMNLAGCDFMTAMQYLMKVFNITDR